MYAVYFLALFVAVASAAPAEDKYTTKYDSVDVDNILKNDRLLTAYSNCMMERGKCTPDGEELKKNLPDALATECKKCSEKQKAGAEKVLKFLYEKKPELFKELEEKYDPDQVYRKKYAKEGEKRGIKV